MSEEIKETATVEISEPVASTEPQAPSRDELKEKGWSAQELESAEKRGMIPKKEEKEVPKVQQGVEQTKVQAEPAQPEVKDERRKEQRPNGALPSFEMTPEQEKVFFDTFGPGTEPRAMYFRMKNERQARQRIEQESKRQMDELKAEIAAIKAGKPQVEVDENGNEIDPDDKPLTMKQLRELKQREAEEAQEKANKDREAAQRNAEAMKDQEEFAKAQFPDFDETITAAGELIQDLSILPPWQQAKAQKLIRELQVAAQNAEKYGIEDYNAALISYELGQMNPNRKSSPNGQRAEPQTDGNLEVPDKKANGSLNTREQMKRIEANTQRRASSASIPGGNGKRVVSVEDITVAELLKMDSDQRASFKKKHPEQFAKLLRG